MSTPITDKAEVSIDFPDKFFVGSFGRGSRFDVTADKEGVHIHLDRQSGEKRHVGFHVHYYLFADILSACATAIGKVENLEPEHKAALQEVARKWASLK